MNNGVSWDADDPAIWNVAGPERTRQLATKERYLRQPAETTCLCGGRIRAVPTTTGIAEAVRAHQKHPRHRQWWRDAGW